MNQMTEISVPRHKVSDYENYSILDLVFEMQSLGVDPDPLLKAAAHDIILKHGPKVVSYAECMLHQMIIDNNPNGIFLWKKLSDIVNDYYLKESIRIH